MNQATETDAKSHYNLVSDAWRFIFGDNFHFGYFRSDDMDLPEATNALIDELAQLGTITKNSNLLDVGCGIGEPAIYLHEKHHCRITGITISEKGVELATQKCKERGYTHMVQFQLADALDNGFPSDNFDFVWQMESSHLIRDKGKLFLENFRVLKNYGTMLLSDLILKRDLTVVEIYNYRRELRILEKSFGKVKMVTLKNYSQELKKTGFSEIETIDISKWVFPTLGHWQNNITQNRKSILKHFDEDNVSNFLLSCEILKDFFKDTILGYGLVKAKKVEKKSDE